MVYSDYKAWYEIHGLKPMTHCFSEDSFYNAFHTVLDLRCVKNDLENDREICAITTYKSEELPLSAMTSSFAGI